MSKKITIRDIEEENVEFERGIWVFLASNLLELRTKLWRFLKAAPTYIQESKRIGSKKPVYINRPHK